jgi:hypothetical protein
LVAINDLVRPDDEQSVHVAFSLKDAAVVNIDIKLPLVIQLVNAQRGVFRILTKESQLLLDLLLDRVGQRLVGSFERLSKFR